MELKCRRDQYVTAPKRELSIRTGSSGDYQKTNFIGAVGGYFISFARLRRWVSNVGTGIQDFRWLLNVCRALADHPRTCPRCREDGGN